MCTFHQQRQAGILLERQGGKRASYVLFTHHSRQIGILFEMEGGGRTVCVRFTDNKVVCASELKTQKFRNGDGAILLKYWEVVPTELMPRNAIRVRFEEGWR